MLFDVFGQPPEISTRLARAEVRARQKFFFGFRFPEKNRCLLHQERSKNIKIWLLKVKNSITVRILYIRAVVLRECMILSMTSSKNLKFSNIVELQSKQKIPFFDIFSSFMVQKVSLRLGEFKSRKFYGARALPRALRAIENSKKRENS